ncbi:DUF4209 domain-containing protein [Pectobacterium aroidearum]|uniref:DUF4209 domain-containing protein n=1 Tax=Pectobacterium aroidearum TaxID=1201031 RepID=A0ABR5ZAB8_9GAMM|nr:MULTISPECIES: DUF4209 domain-containing protein [Pectobacterium]MBA5198717.1 DUF4209 domain-containing protein [Pectobacterium aroidearum]MBA5226779.1 DUF4209 domain-containing protein [Pectobacterium aroidearum]MBA5231509.1 DUF4209 domain-containing protein [Pectobacterium aroidearum]MBA5736655.1 DUF4209 domain-containing protein [Pectobacterium aroidearum]UXJ98724.1 DUF4209 domain-containing protein [Pectobacterium aroidearum]
MTNAVTSLSNAPPPLTMVDFQAAGLEALLDSHPEANSQDLQTLLSDAAKTHASGPARALTLLSNIISMMLVPTDQTQVFRPFIELSDGRSSMGPDHLTSADIDVLVQVCDTIQQPVLRARIADLIWLRDPKRGHHYPKMAIEAYRAKPINISTWHSGVGVGWHRALQLAKQIRATDEIEKTVHAMLNAFFDATTRPDISPLHFVRPLLTEKKAAGRERDVAVELEAIGHKRFEAASAFDAESFFKAAADWYQWARDADQHDAMLAMVARAISLQAEQANGAITEHHWYTKAIEAYRRVAARSRKRLGVDEAIEELRRKREKAGHGMLEEMVMIRGPSIDISDLVAAAVDHVKGRHAVEALMAFIRLDSPPDADALKAEAETLLREHPLSTMFSGAVMASDGRQVANTGPKSGWDNQVDEKVREMFRHHAHLVAVSSLMPALDQIRFEHRYHLADFIEIAERSPIVPSGRAYIIGKGLFAGFCGDMVQAMHTLMPQFEHMVRYVLQGAEAFTAEHRPDGRDMEVALASLLDRPQMAEEFGEGLTLAIRAIMCDQAGSNLRNDIAHGLADEELCSAPFALYAWWIVLQLVVETFAAAQEISASKTIHATANETLMKDDNKN